MYFKVFSGQKVCHNMGHFTLGVCEKTHFNRRTSGSNARVCDKNIGSSATEEIASSLLSSQ